MVFASNSLSVTHDSGFGVTFNALDALRLVDAEHDLMKVAVAQEWQEARSVLVGGTVSISRRCGQ